MDNPPGMNDYEAILSRTCRICGHQYSIRDYWSGNEHYFGGPYHYSKGCVDHCLGCWLGVGPEDCSSAEQRELPVAGNNSIAVNLPAESDPVMDREAPILEAYRHWLDAGCHLAVMPIGRIHIQWDAQYFPWGTTFYPPGGIDLAPLNVKENREDTHSLAESQSALSQVSAELVEQHHAVVFPCRFDWGQFRRSGYAWHMELIRHLSSQVDRTCMDFIRYSLCRLGHPDDLPSRAGQLDSNPMMAGAILYNHSLREARVIGGAAFHRMTTRGLGLELEQLELDQFPGDGEVGKIVQHALTLFSAMLEASDETSMFMQALSLMECLIDPYDYTQSEDVKKGIARYVANNAVEYKQLLERLCELNGKKDPDTKKVLGYRTRVVHMGERLDRIVPDPKQRLKLLRELTGYIGQIINHMIKHSEMTFEEYLKIREQLKPFAV